VFSKVFQIKERGPWEGAEFFYFILKRHAVKLYDQYMIGGGGGGGGGDLLAC
jgi:hypothetical protein